jgi:dTDP-4-dehydrorhamnose reductase
VKALITGATGQLGQALARSVPPDVEAIALDHEALDLGDAALIESKLGSIQPSVVINAAAYTAVDRAESEPARAYAINADAVGVMARYCNGTRTRLVHVSTDFVFDGSSGRPYRPDDATNPLSVYGASKLAGEQQRVAQPGLDWRIVRTAWVYASSGRNFALTMLRLFRERSAVRVVSDQIGSPTSAPSLARCVWAAALSEGPSEVSHYTDAGVASWYDFAVAIYEEARQIGLVGADVDIIPIRTSEYPTPARRPAYSVLDCASTRERFGLPPVHWRSNVRNVLGELAA